MPESSHPIDVEAFAANAIYSMDFTDRSADALEDRVVRLEELLFARWPRRWLLRRRLARELRVSVAGYGDWMPPDFRTRRLQYAGEMITWQSLQRRAASPD